MFCLYKTSTIMYQFVTALLVVDALGFGNALQCGLDQGARLGRRLMQITMQFRVVFVPICTLGAVHLECRQVTDQLRQVMRALAVDGCRCPRQPRQLLMIEQAWWDRFRRLPF